MTEEWKPIADFEEFYMVSSEGRVKSLPRMITTRDGYAPYLLHGRMLKLRYTHGYAHVVLKVEGASKNMRVHKLVCAAFCGPAPSPTHITAHNDGNSKNNRQENLRWATPADNTLDQTCHGTDLRGSKLSWAVLTEADIPNIRRYRREGMTLLAIAKLFNVHFSNIGHIVNNRTWRHVVDQS